MYTLTLTADEREQVLWSLMTASNEYARRRDRAGDIHHRNGLDDMKRETDFIWLKLYDTPRE